jgi:hypothetical protein
MEESDWSEFTTMVQLLLHHSDKYDLQESELSSKDVEATALSGVSYCIGLFPIAKIFVKPCYLIVDDSIILYTCKGLFIVHFVESFEICDGGIWVL